MAGIATSVPLKSTIVNGNKSVGHYGFGKLAGRFVGGDVKTFFDSHVATGFGDMMISIVGLLLAFWLVHFLYRRKIFLRI